MENIIKKILIQAVTGCAAEKLWKNCLRSLRSPPAGIPRKCFSAAPLPQLVFDNIFD